MKKFVVAAFAAVLVVAGCVGMQARTGAMSTIATAYATIIQPVLLVGVGAEQDAGRLKPADAEAVRLAISEVGRLLDGGDLSQATLIKQTWDRLLPFANSGIDAQVAKGEIGPGVAASLKETLRLFGERLLQLQQGQTRETVRLFNRQLLPIHP